MSAVPDLMRWMPTSGGVIPRKAVYFSNDAGTKRYLCRGIMKGSVEKALVVVPGEATIDLGWCQTFWFTRGIHMEYQVTRSFEQRREQSWTQNCSRIIPLKSLRQRLQNPILFCLSRCSLNWKMTTPASETSDIIGSGFQALHSPNLRLGPEPKHSNLSPVENNHRSPRIPGNTIR